MSFSSTQQNFYRQENIRKNTIFGLFSRLVAMLRKISFVSLASTEHLVRVTSFKENFIMIFLRNTISRSHAVKFLYLRNYLENIIFSLVSDIQVYSEEFLPLRKHLEKQNFWFIQQTSNNIRKNFFISSASTKHSFSPALQIRAIF